MKRLLGCALLVFAAAAPELAGQALASPRPQAQAAKRDEAKGEAPKDAIKQAMGATTQANGQPITTEIYADEAFFDSANHIGVFSGRVVVNDPRFNVQADKLTVYLRKTPGAEPNSNPAEQASGASNQALEKAVAEGNVGVVRERPGENGGPPVRSIGRGEMAVYTTSDGKVELRGTPRVQSGVNVHVATSRDTVMVLDGGGQLYTKGPSRTEIRQEAKPGETPTPPPSFVPRP